MVYVLRLTWRGLKGEIGFCITVVFERGSGSFSYYVFLACVSCGGAGSYNACLVYHIILGARALRWGLGWGDSGTYIKTKLSKIYIEMTNNKNLFVDSHYKLLIGLNLTSTPIPSRLGYSLHSIDPKNQASLIAGVAHDQIEGLVFSRTTNLELCLRQDRGQFAAFCLYMVVPWRMWVFHDISWSILTCVCMYCL